MRIPRDRRWIAAGVLLLAAIGTGTWAASARIREWWWTRTAAEPLSAEELASLESCAEVPWSAWVKVLATDPPLACGEARAVRSLADLAGRGARRDWVVARAADPAAPAGARQRASVALLLGGIQPLAEPMFLLADLPPERLEGWRAAAREDEELATQLGPGAAAIRTLELAEAGELDAEGALPVLRWLVAVGDASVLARVDALLVRWGAPDQAQVRALQEQRRRHAPPRDPEMPAREALAGCGDPACFPERLRLVERQLGSPEGAGPEPVGEEGPPWEEAALARWLAAAPEPEARLAALLARPGTGPTAALAWDGSGAPWAVAAQVVRLVDPAPEIRSSRPESVWFRVGGGWVERTCGAPGALPDASPLDPATVEARALLEAAGPTPDPRARALARSLDPGLPAPPVHGDPVGFRIGAALAAPPEPAGDRGIGPEGPWCPARREGRAPGAAPPG